VILTIQIYTLKTITQNDTILSGKFINTINATLSSVRNKDLIKVVKAPCIGPFITSKEDKLNPENNICHPCPNLMIPKTCVANGLSSCKIGNVLNNSPTGGFNGPSSKLNKYCYCPFNYQTIYYDSSKGSNYIGCGEKCPTGFVATECTDVVKSPFTKNGKSYYKIQNTCVPSPAPICN
jgi:hypothetical protein